MHDTAPMTCELCDELSLDGPSTYRQIYGPGAPRREFDAEGNIVSLVSLGQLFCGSAMVLPREHRETTAELSPRDIRDTVALVQRLRLRTRVFGYPVVFEHGAKCRTGHGCGIYHAHVHVVPLPSPIDVQQLLPLGAPARSLRAAFEEAESADEYLVAADAFGEVRIELDVSAEGRSYPSQYFRQRLAQIFFLDKWNWRDFDAAENLPSIVHLVRAAHDERPTLVAS